MKNNSVLLAGIVGIFVLFIGAAWWLLTPSWVNLMPGQIAEEAKPGVINQLMELGVDYQVDEATGEILVQDTIVSAVRGQLSEVGVPTQNQVGLEVFNDSDYGLSEFVQNVNYQRAVEVELARTIRELDGVKSARVHLTMAKESLFKERQKSAKASVVVEPAQDAQFSSTQILGIKEIVATAVSGLSPEAVSIIHINGTPLSGEASVKAQYLGQTRDVEDRYADTIFHLLQGLMPQADIRVGVNVSMDTSKRKVIAENIIPKNSRGDGYLVKSRTTSATSKSDAEAESGESKEVQERDYSYSVEKSETVYSGGVIQRINVGVVITGENLLVDQEDSISKVIASAIGADISRGDVVNLVMMPSSSETAIAETAEPVDESFVITQPAAVSNTVNHDPNTAASFSSVLKQFPLLVGVVFGMFCLLIIMIVLWLKARARAERYDDSNLSREERENLLSEFRLWMEA